MSETPRAVMSDRISRVSIFPKHAIPQLLAALLAVVGGCKEPEPVAKPEPEPIAEPIPEVEEAQPKQPPAPQPASEPAAEIPEKYQDPRYCEKDDDCTWYNPGCCCGAIGVNVHNRPAPAKCRGYCKAYCRHLQVEVKCAKNRCEAKRIPES